MTKKLITPFDAAELGPYDFEGVVPPNQEMFFDQGYVSNGATPDGIFALAEPISSARPAQVLGYTIGQATEGEVWCSLQDRGASVATRGLSAHAGGQIIEAHGPSWGVLGLTRALLIFDAHQTLAGGLLTVTGPRFYSITQVLKGKYTLLREDPPSGGNRCADFQARDVLVTANAPDLSSEMTVMYRTVAVQQSMDREAHAEAERRRQDDLGQF